MKRGIWWAQSNSSFDRSSHTAFNRATRWSCFPPCVWRRNEPNELTEFTREPRSWTRPPLKVKPDEYLFVRGPVLTVHPSILTELITGTDTHTSCYLGSFVRGTFCRSHDSASHKGCNNKDYSSSSWTFPASLLTAPASNVSPRHAVVLARFLFIRTQRGGTNTGWREEFAPFALLPLCRCPAGFEAHGSGREMIELVH